MVSRLSVSVILYKKISAIRLGQNFHRLADGVVQEALLVGRTGQVMLKSVCLVSLKATFGTVVPCHTGDSPALSLRGGQGKTLTVGGAAELAARGETVCIEVMGTPGELMAHIQTGLRC